MTWSVVLALVAMTVSLVAMYAFSANRQAVLGGFATLNLAAAVLVASAMSSGPIATALEWIFVITGLVFLVGEMRASRADRRRHR